MQLDAKTFEDVLKTLKKTIGKKSLPHTQNVYFMSNPDRSLTVYTTNAETMQMVNFPPQFEQDPGFNGGPVGVPFKELQQSFDSKHDKWVYVKLFRDTQLCISQRDNRNAYLNIDQEHTVFPADPSFSQQMMVEFRENDWRALREQVVPFADKNDARPALNGILVESGENGYTFTGVNGFILGQIRMVTEVNASFDPIIVPIKALEAIPKKIGSSLEFEGHDGEFLHIAYTYKGNEFYMVTRLIDAHFPDYRHVFPWEVDSEVRISKSVIEQAAKLKLQNDRLDLYVDCAYAVSDKGAEYEWPETTELKNVERAAFDVRYLKRLLAFAPSNDDYLTLRGSNPNSAWRVDAPYASAVIMPMVIDSRNERRAA